MSSSGSSGESPVKADKPLTDDAPLCFGGDSPVKAEKPFCWGEIRFHISDSLKLGFKFGSHVTDASGHTCPSYVATNVGNLL